jgi:hypothetical protein
LFILKLSQVTMTAKALLVTPLSGCTVDPRNQQVHSSTEAAMEEELDMLEKDCTQCGTWMLGSLFFSHNATNIR